MTREEAIKDLTSLVEVRRKYVGMQTMKDEIECLEMAIKALEQESVLDKIRAEIMQLDYNLESVDYDKNDMAMTEEVHMICREELLQIIDRYRVESEEENE